MRSTEVFLSMGCIFPNRGRGNFPTNVKFKFYFKILSLSLRSSITFSLTLPSTLSSSSKLSFYFNFNLRTIWRKSIVYRSLHWSWDRNNEQNIGASQSLYAHLFFNFLAGAPTTEINSLIAPDGLRRKIWWLGGG